jgi:hypothetical protein
VVVKNQAGEVRSNTAVISIVRPVSILKQPVGGVFRVGVPAGLAVQVDGGAPLTYQWFKNGAAVAGGTATQIAFASLKETDAGSYSVQIKNAANAVSSEVVTVSPVIAPTIITQPVSVERVVGGTAVLTVVAQGSSPLNYQWKKFDGVNASNVAGGTLASLTMNPLTEASLGQYFVVVSNPVVSATWGTVVSGTVKVTRPLEAPVVTYATPSPTRVAVGTGLTLGWKVRGATDWSYKLLRSGVAIAGGTGSFVGSGTIEREISLPIPSVTATAEYTLQMVSGSLARSSVVQVVAVQKPVISVQPVGGSVALGGSFTLSVTAAAEPLSYQWRLNNGDIAGGTSATLRITPVTLGAYGTYSVVVSTKGALNRTDSVVSSNAILTRSSEKPRVVTPIAPASLAVAIGASTSITARIAGETDWFYQWFKDGVARGVAIAVVGGADAREISTQIAKVALIDAGKYELRAWAKDKPLEFVSTSTTLSTVGPPQIIEQPADKAVALGGSLTLSVKATGTPPLTYQWTFNGANIATAGTASSYVVSSVAPVHMGSYAVVVTGSGGSTGPNLSTTSRSAVVKRLAVLPVFTLQPASVALVIKGSATLTAKVKGETAWSYRWYKGATPLGSVVSMPASTAEVLISLPLSNATDTTAGDYQLVAWNELGQVPAGTARSAIAKVSIVKSIWVRASLSASVKTTDLSSFPSGTSVVFPAIRANDVLTVTVVDIPGISYRWQYIQIKAPFQTIDLGQTSASLNFGGLVEQKGTFQLTATYPQGSSSIKFVVQSVSPAAAPAELRIVAEPSELLAKPGSTAQFLVSAKGDVPTYQWYRLLENGEEQPMSGGASWLLEIANVEEKQGGLYFVEISDTYGNTVRSKNVRLVVLPRGE